MGGAGSGTAPLKKANVGAVSDGQRAEFLRIDSQRIGDHATIGVL